MTPRAPSATAAERLSVEEIEDLVSHGFDRAPLNDKQKAFLRARKRHTTDAEALRDAGVSTASATRWKHQYGRSSERFLLVYRAYLGDQVSVDLDEGTVALPAGPTTNERIREAFDDTSDSIPEVLKTLRDIALYGQDRPAIQLRAIKMILDICGVGDSNNLPKAMTVIQHSILNWSGQTENATPGRPILPGNLVEIIDGEVRELTGG